MKKTGNRTHDKNGDEWFEVNTNEGLVWLPVHPDIVYGKTGEWRGWDDFLGVNNDLKDQYEKNHN